MDNKESEKLAKNFSGTEQPKDESSSFSRKTRTVLREWKVTK